jgi:hypothetical protein
VIRSGPHEPALSNDDHDLSFGCFGVDTLQAEIGEQHPYDGLDFCLVEIRGRQPQHHGQDADVYERLRNAPDRVILVPESQRDFGVTGLHHLHGLFSMARRRTT